ncbi:VWA domain-containing protein [Streptomyces bauhiniae]|uniref:VWA domain-containing protein n=1 Tax=Streptomyces bauhiniae TaxID=2340725 RepID=UPI003660B924
MEPAILDADPEVVVPQQRTEPLPEAEAEHDQPAIPEQSTEPPTDTSAEPSPTPEADANQESTTTPAAKADTEPEPTPASKAEAETEPKAAPAPKAKAQPDAAKTTPEPEAKPKAPAEPEAKTEPEAKAPAEPEPKADPEPTPAPETEATTAPKAKAKPKAKAPAEPKAQAEPKAKAAAEAEPEAEAKTEAAVGAEPTSAPGAEPEAGTAPAPDAADAPAPPPAAPAGDNASRTGGAGGKTPEAEGVAEAEPLRGTPSLTTAHAAAAATLANTDLTGTAAKLYLVLDRSASMRPYYKDGSAQALADQTLALAAHLDKDPTVHVVFFSTEVDGTTDLTLTEDHATKIDDTHATLGRMGRTSYHAAVEAVLAHHDKHHTPEDNVLVVFQTDGAPDAKTPATQALTNAKKTHPNVFFSFVAFGEPDNKAFDYLRKLKTGNTSFFHAGPTPRELTDTELYEGVLATWRP